MDQLQEKIDKTYKEMSKEDKIEVLQESIEFHRKTAHFHMYMERHFATKLQDLTGESQESIADAVTSQDGTVTADNEWNEASEKH